MKTIKTVGLLLIVFALPGCGALSMLKDAAGFPPGGKNSGTQVDTKLNVQHGNNSKTVNAVGSETPTDTAVKSQDIKQSQVAGQTQYNANSITINKSSIGYYILALLFLLLMFWILPQHPLKLMKYLHDKLMDIEGEKKNA